jgi:hypothetical protein
MSVVYADRVKETSTTTGTGTLDLAGAETGFQGFVAGAGDGARVAYAIKHQSADEWETGIGTVTDAATDTLSRDIILSSSNSGSAVNFSAGTKDVWIDIPANSKLPKGWLHGLELSNDSDANHDIAISAGCCRDESDECDMSLSATLTKQIDATFAAGDDTGGMFTGSVSSNTWYHVFLIRKDADGTIDAGFDTSVSAANIPSGYTAYRRLGSVLTNGSSNIRGFTQSGKLFLWDDPIEDVDVTNPGTSAVLRTMSVPSGVKVRAIFTVHNYSGSGGTYVSPPDVDDESPSTTNAPGYMTENPPDHLASTYMHMLTDTSSRIRTRQGGSSDDIRMWTYGWMETQEGI